MMFIYIYIFCILKLQSRYIIGAKFHNPNTEYVRMEKGKIVA